MDGALSRQGGGLGAAADRGAGLRRGEHRLRGRGAAGRPAGRRCGRAVAEVVAAMQHELAGSRMAERIRDGFEVALVGRPNVGQVDAAECARRPRGGADLGGRRDDARRDRGPDGPRRAARSRCSTWRGCGRPAAGSRRWGSSGRGRGRSGRTCGCSWSVSLREADMLGVSSGSPATSWCWRRRICGRRTDGPAVSGLTGAGIDGLLSAIADRAAGRGARAPAACRTSGNARRSSGPPAAAAEAAAELGRGGAAGGAGGGGAAGGAQGA